MTEIQKQLGKVYEATNLALEQIRDPAFRNSEMLDLVNLDQLNVVRVQYNMWRRFDFPDVFWFSATVAGIDLRATTLLCQLSQAASKISKLRVDVNAFVKGA